MINNENRFKFLREKTTEELVNQLEEEQMELLRCEKDFNFDKYIKIEKLDIHKDISYQHDIIEYLENLIEERQNENTKVM